MALSILNGIDNENLVTYSDLISDAHKESMKVACLYRVSLTKMVEENDIPMQRKACRKYVSNKENWVIVNEYIEKGVSGYKVSINERDEIQNIIRDASKGKFDILLVFSSDRVCRKADEYAPIMKTLSKMIEVWSVAQGDLTVRNHTDALKTYVDGWQNEAESIKISLRTDEKHRQMAEEGMFRGGMPPYGYKLILSGKYNERDKKHRKELYTMVQDEYEVDVIRKIFRLVIEKGFGGNRIAQYLNNSDVNIKNRSGGSWTAPTINYILRNPVYMGYPAYGKNSKKSGNQVRQDKEKWVMPQEQVKKWAIISSEEWYTAQRIRQGNRPNNKYDIPTPTRGRVLLVGFIRCGSCDKPLITAHHQKKWVNKNGTVRTRTNFKYECSGKKRGLPCDGNRIYSKAKIEEPVLEYIKIFLSQLKREDFTNELDKVENRGINKKKAELQKLVAEREKAYRELRALEDEVGKCLLGESLFSREMLVDLINKKNTQIDKIRDNIHQVEEDFKNEQIEYYDLVALQTALPKWEEIFEQSDENKKKMMLSNLIEQVIVYPDRYEVKVKVHIQQFVDSILGVN